MSKKAMTGHEQVDTYMAELQHPLKREIEELRQLIVAIDDEVTEHIKWNAPSFQYRGEDRITFHLKGRSGLMIVFHCGVKKSVYEGKERLIDDPYQLLSWPAADRATLKLDDAADVEARKDKLIELVKLWLKAEL